jgi:phosphoribosylglycinamide formyltransferase-1
MNNKIVVFISGRGSNAKNIINYFSDNSDFQVSHVFSNNRYSDFPNHIKNKNVQYFLFEEAEINGKVFNELKKIKPKLIILEGFLKKITQLYINFFKNKIINIHPSLLPKYGGVGMYGLNIHKKVIENEESETGISIHYVSEEYDSGKIIFQKKIKVDKYDTPEKLEKKIHKLEYEYFPRVIESLLI